MKYQAYSSTIEESELVYGVEATSYTYEYSSTIEESEPISQVIISGRVQVFIDHRGI